MSSFSFPISFSRSSRRRKSFPSFAFSGRVLPPLQPRSSAWLCALEFFWTQVSKAVAAARPVMVSSSSLTVATTISFTAVNVVFTRALEASHRHPEYSHTFTLHSGSADAKCYSVGFDCRDVDSVRHITRFSLVADKNTYCIVVLKMFWKLSIKKACSAGPSSARCYEF